MPETLTQARLKELTIYDPESGVFYARAGRRGVKAGSILGVRKETGYLSAYIDHKRYYLHRLAFLYMQGEWPLCGVDHANRNKEDNRWANLRLADKVENSGNSKMRKDNTTGFRGVVRHQGRYRARIKFRGRFYELGVHGTAEDAGRAYEYANRELLGEFTHFNEGIVR